MKEVVNYVSDFLLGSSASLLTYEIHPFIESTAGVGEFESFLNSLKSIDKPYRFVIQGNAKSKRIYVVIHKKFKEYFENVFYNFFSTSHIVACEENFAISTFISLRGEIKTKSDFTKEGTYAHPLRQVLGLFAIVPGEEKVTIQFVYKNPKIKLSVKEEQTHVSLSIGFHYEGVKLSSIITKELIYVFKNYLVRGKISFSGYPRFFGQKFDQIVNFFYLPTSDMYDPSLHYSFYRTLPHPSSLPTTGISSIGYTNYRNEHMPFGIKPTDKMRHMYIVGKTGSGKSTLLNNMIIDDIRTGKGVCVIDPHGELIETVGTLIPENRKNDVVLFDVSDSEFPLGFNPLDCSKEQELVTVSGVVSTFKKLYGDSRGPRLEYILRNSLLTIMIDPHPSLVKLLRLLTDKNYRKSLVSQLQDPLLTKFRHDEFDKWTDKFREEAVNPIINKVGQYLSSSTIRNIFCQEKSSLTIRQFMDSGKILLVNLSKGKIGEDVSFMIGAFLVTKIQIEAISRADIPFDQRKDFYLYIDEFQNFATESFESILSEARKYKLGLIVANQYISQLEDTIKNAIFGNCGTIISFALGHEDAIFMANQFKNKVSPSDILSIGRGNAYIRLMIDGVMSDPFSMGYDLTPGGDTRVYEELRDLSRRRYATPRKQVEEHLSGFTGTSFTPQDKINAYIASHSPDFSQKQSSLTENSFPPQKLENKSNKIDTSSTDNVAEIHNLEGIKLEPEREYEGIVKIKFNYGLFIIVGRYEGLLHKSHIIIPEGIESRKKLYEVGDSIRVKFLSDAESDQGQKILWTQ